MTTIKSALKILKAILLTTLLVSFVSCNQSQIEVDSIVEKASGGKAGQAVSVTSVDVVANQLVINGVNLDSATSVRVTGPAGFDETFDIESQNGSQLIANSQSNITMLVNGLFSLIVSNAYGAATYTISFELQDGQVTAAKLSGMGAAAGDVLTYNGSSWGPSPLTGLSFEGTFDASSPANQTGSAPASGHYYIVQTPGTRDPDGALGGNTYAVGDWAVYNGTTSSWDKVVGSSDVVSVNGQTGAVTLGWADIFKTGSVISDIANVDDSGKNIGDILEWDGTNWVAVAPVTDTNTNASTICGAGQVLLGDGSCTALPTDTNAATQCGAGEYLDGDGTCQTVPAVVNAATLCNANEYLDGDGTCKAVPTDTDTDTNAGTLCNAGEYLDGDGTCQAVPTPTTSLSVGNITNAGGEYFAYQPNGVACTNGQVLEWNGPQGWICGTKTVDTTLTIDTNTSLGNSDTVVPSQNAVQTYVDTATGAITSSQWITSGSDIYYNPGNVAIGTGAAGTSRTRIFSNGLTNDKVLEVTGSGVSGGQSGPFYGAFIDAPANNNATSRYGLYAEGRGGGGGANYGVYGTTSMGSSTRLAAGVQGHVSVNSAAVNNHPSSSTPVVGVLATATSSGTTMNAVSTALLVRNEMVFGATSFGAYIDAMAGPTTVIPLSVNYDGSEIFRVTSGGQVRLGSSTQNSKLNIGLPGENGEFVSMRNEDAEMILMSSEITSFNHRVPQITLTGSNNISGDRGVGGKLVARSNDVFQASDAVMQFDVKTSANGNIINSNLYNWSNNDSQLMTMDKDGQLGIGINVPTQKLTVAGNINVTTGNDICIDGAGCLSSAVAGGGETNTASNLGTGANVFESKSGVDLQFRSIASADSSVTITQNANDINLAVSKAVNEITSGVGLYFSYQPNNVACTNGQVLEWNGPTGWVCGDKTTDTNTTYTAGNGIDATIFGSNEIALDLTAGTALSLNGVSGALESAWLMNGTDLHYNGGNLGIGTTTPTGFETGTGSKYIELKGGGSAELNIDSGGNSSGHRAAVSFSINGTRTSYIANQKSTTSAVDGSLLFGTYDGTTLSEKMRIEQGGFVGIGITNPRSILHVRGTNARPNFTNASNAVSALTQDIPGLELLIDGNQNAGTQRYGMGIKFMAGDNQLSTESEKFVAGIFPAATETIDSDEDGGHALEFFTTPNQPGATNVPNRTMLINQDGNVAIGAATNPVEKLSVEGVVAIQEGAVPTASSGYGKVYVKTDNKLYFMDDAGTEYDLLGNNGGLGTHTATQNLVLGSNYLSGDGDNEGITVSSTGLVTFSGIGAATGSLEVGTPGGHVGMALFSNAGDRRDIRINDSAMHLALSTNGSAPDLNNGLTIEETGQVGIGTSTPNASLDIAGGSNPTIRISEGGSTTSYSEFIDLDATNASFRKVAATGQPIIQMNPIASDGTSNAKFRFFRDTNTTGIKSLEIFAGDGTATLDAAINVGGNSYFNVGGGNVGIGTGSPGEKLEVRNGSILMESNVGNNLLLSTTVGNGNDSELKFRKARGGAVGPSVILVDDSLGSIRFEGYDGTSYVEGASITSSARNVASGVMDSDLAFRTSGAVRMIITDSGDVGVNSSIPDSTFEVTKVDAAKSLALFDDNLAANNNSDVEIEAFRPGLVLRDTTTNSFDWRMGADLDDLVFSLDNDNDGAKTANSDFDDNPNILALKPSGRVGIGTRTPGAKFDIYGTGTMGTLGSFNTADAYLRVSENSGATNMFMDGNTLFTDNTFFTGTLGSNPIVFATSEIERMRISETGNVGIGVTNPSNKLQVQDSNASHIALFYNTSTSTNARGIDIRIGPNANPGAGNDFIVFRDGDGTSVGSIYGNGSGGVAYGTGSDRRIKENIEPTIKGLAEVLAIEISDFNFIGADIRETGYIAQQLYEIFPEAVARPENEDEEIWTVDYGRLTPLAIAAIQDLHRNMEMFKLMKEGIDERQDRAIASLQQENHEIKAELQQIKAENRDLKAKNEELEERLERLEKLLLK